MAGLRTATKIGERMRAAGDFKQNLGTFVTGAGIGIGIGLTGTGVGAVFGYIGSAITTTLGVRLLQEGSAQYRRGVVLDTLSRGQTQLGALYGRPPSAANAAPDASGSLGVMRFAANKALAEMGQTSTMGAGGNAAAPAAGPQSDGQTDGYTRQRNGRMETVRGYATPGR